MQPQDISPGCQFVRKEQAGTQRFAALLSSCGLQATDSMIKERNHDDDRDWDTKEQKQDRTHVWISLRFNTQVEFRAKPRCPFACHRWCLQGLHRTHQSATQGRSRAECERLFFASDLRPSQRLQTHPRPGFAPALICVAEHRTKQLNATPKPKRILRIDLSCMTVELWNA